MPHSDQPDTSTWDRIDEPRKAHLDDQGSPGYSAVVVITRDGEERLCLCWRDGLNRPGHPYWPDDWRQRAPHELTGRLPKPYAPTCGRPTTSGRPCRVGVRRWGDACNTHLHLDAERIQPA